MIRFQVQLVRIDFKLMLNEAEQVPTGTEPNQTAADLRRRFLGILSGRDKSLCRSDKFDRTVRSLRQTRQTISTGCKAVGGFDRV